LAYEVDGKLVHQSWNSEGPIDPPGEIAAGTSPRWSRDGFRLLLIQPRSSAPAAAQAVIVRNLMSEKDLDLPVASPGTVRSPAWAPDEGHVAFYLKPPGEKSRWRIHVSPVAENGTGTLLGDDVVVNPDFDSEGPSWEPGGRRIWFFSHAHRRQAYYPLITGSIETGKLAVVDYPNCCTTPNDLAINPVTQVPEIAFVAHDGLPQDLFIVFLNHF
jgi:dipeptidyl aminopeptidase/acylaminoacyl peptidase